MNISKNFNKKFEEGERLFLDWFTLYQCIVSTIQILLRIPDFKLDICHFAMEWQPQIWSTLFQKHCLAMF